MRCGRFGSFHFIVRCLFKFAFFWENIFVPVFVTRIVMFEIYFFYFCNASCFPGVYTVIIENVK